MKLSELINFLNTEVELSISDEYDRHLGYFNIDNINKEYLDCKILYMNPYGFCKLYVEIDTYTLN